MAAALALSAGLRPIALRALLAEFGSPQAVLAQSFTALATITDGDTTKGCVRAPVLGAAFDSTASTNTWRVPSNGRRRLEITC